MIEPTDKQAEYEAMEAQDEQEEQDGQVSPMPLVVGRFLRALFPELARGEQMELRLITKPDPILDTRVRCAFFTTIGPLWERAQEWRDQGDVYIGVAPRRGNIGTAAGVTRLHCIWGDFDFKDGHTHDTRRQQLRTLECRPSMVVNSGRGFHAYWLLEKPVEENGEIEKAVSIMRRMAEEMGCDKVGDKARILRLPCTLNYKYSPPVEVIVAGYEPYRRYTLAQLEGMLLWPPPASGGQLSVVSSRKDEDQISRPPLPATDHRPPTTPSLLDTTATLQGVPEGQRDITLFRLACKLRRAGVPQDMAARLVLEAAQNCTPPFPAREAVVKVVRAYMKYPEGPAEEVVMQLESRARPDAGLRSIYAEGSSPGTRREVIEANGAALVAAAGVERPDPPSLPFLGQNGYIIEQWSHLLAGYPRCGKSELLVRLCAEWLAAGKRVVYLTEEPQSIWEHRLARVAGDWSGLQVIFALGTSLDLLFRRAFEGEEEVVVIDTMRNLLRLEDETDNSRIAAVLNPWIAGARSHHKTLVMAHHMRKGSGDHGEGIAGGHALLGVFDIALQLKRDDHKKNRRRIEAFARLIEPSEMIYEMAEDGTMKSLGDPASLQLADVVERVRAVVGDEWEKTSEVREALGEPLPGPFQVRAALLHLAHAGEIERDPPMSDEAERKTVRWRLKPN